MDVLNISSEFKLSDFAKDLEDSVLLTPLKAMIFPLMETSDKIKTVSYSNLEDNYLGTPSVISQYVGKTFSASINTYYHDNKTSSMAIAENVIWHEKPDWISGKLIELLQSDATARGLKVMSGFLPIFLIVSRKAEAIWGVHRDSIPRRIHYPLKSKDCNIRFYTDNTYNEEYRINFVEGVPSLLDVSKLHNVYCKNDELRVHIVVDCLLNG